MYITLIKKCLAAILDYEQRKIGERVESVTVGVGGGRRGGEGGRSSVW